MSYAFSTDDALYVEIYSETQNTYRRYTALKPKQQASFRESHYADIVRHENARPYLAEMMNGKSTIPIGKWRSEASKRNADHAAMYADYVRLRSEVQDAERILCCVKQVLRSESQQKVEREENIVL